MSEQNRQKVLFLCTHNSARSQMAEGLLGHLAGETYQVFSAGTEKTCCRPQAIQVMTEVGIDIAHQESKTIEQYLQDTFDEVITVCDDANEACPVFPKARNRRHWSLPDPSKAQGSEEDLLKVYREVRDAIQRKIEEELL